MGEWLYYRAYVTDLDKIRDLLADVVSPAISNLKTKFPDLQWFYLQYIDLLGLHLRLRLYGEQDQIAAYEDELDGPLNARAESVLKRLYEPEHDKYGAAGVPFAERVFQLGSEAALACAGARRRAARVLCGAAHTDLIVRGLPPRSRVAFLHQYAWYWSGRGLRTAVWPVPATARVAPGPGRAPAAKLRAHIDGVLADPHARRVLTGYAGDFWAMLGSAARPRTRTDFTLAFHHIHLMNNRLGVAPGEEAQIARLLWVEAHDTCHTEVLKDRPTGDAAEISKVGS
ncbi:hypothetical protein Ssi03_48820 [Sphaerisporangium siamense]|uniref:Thiopeptide-type bacteriocin biosynthesis protein n=1 Tax=Sphaerisporangium siamense TaxID=795645 RepID=A0A7W7D370_9ACTN|nr:thiopeptide-type bacteriocin biosynthesis protein [Sphaerisporangium siamense]MBB4699479.1 thiopeptide-type bacteriocin biosynthesis protein [Sphaerisporangium siamense]GII86892.1 hypothetical protein Ssi03_48820 [Sphaerisporangium siamense]